MMSYRRGSEAAARFDERRRREDAAARLLDQVPSLRSLRLDLVEHEHAGGPVAMKHVRHIVVARAPSLFVLLCGDHDCQDGGFDITREVLQELRTGATTFAGDKDCRGTRHGDICRRRLHYTGHASYAEADTAVSDPLSLC
jgi:hypothetical protein